MCEALINSLEINQKKHGFTVLDVPSSQFINALATFFKECNHYFHKECFENIKNIYKNDITKFYIENNFCPKCNDVI